MKNTKTTKPTETKWYLFLNGKTATVHNSTAEIDLLKGVVIEISANEAANILLLEKSVKAD